MDDILEEWLQPESKSPSADQWSQIRGNLETMTTQSLTLLYCFVKHKDFEINKQSYMNNIPKPTRRWDNLCNLIKQVYDSTALKEQAPGFNIITTMHKLDLHYSKYHSYSIIFH